MSDYLSSLAARSLGAGDDVRPRLGSLFEPVEATPLLDEQASERPAAASSEPRAAPGALAAIGAEREGPPPRLAPVPTPAGLAEVAPGFAPDEEPPVSPDAPETGIPAAGRPPATRRERTTVVVRQRRSSTPGEPAPTAHGLLSEEPLPLDARPSRRAHASRSAPQEPPVVRVTIGRIDVRAVQSPAPAPPPALEPHTLPQRTLAEYLRRGARE